MCQSGIEAYEMHTHLHKALPQARLHAQIHNYVQVTVSLYLIWYEFLQSRSALSQAKLRLNVGQNLILSLRGLQIDVTRRVCHLLLVCAHA